MDWLLKVPMLLTEIIFTTKLTQAKTTYTRTTLGPDGDPWLVGIRGDFSGALLGACAWDQREVPNCTADSGLSFR